MAFDIGPNWYNSFVKPINWAAMSSSNSNSGDNNQGQSQGAQLQSLNPTNFNDFLSQEFTKYGIDPNNPGIAGLGNVGYFAGRANETGGGWENQGNRDYWKDRTDKEIQKYAFGIGYAGDEA